MLDDPKVEISVIKSQLESIQKSINDVKESLNHMTEIRTSVAVMQQKHSSYIQDLEALETRVQEAEMRITNNGMRVRKMDLIDRPC